MFDFFADTAKWGTEHAYRVLAGDFVSVEDGTGVVHMAPGFGEDDQVVANAAGIPTICPMDEHGQFTAEVGPWAGTHVFDANPLIIRALKERGVVLRHATYDHSYPHCWRCNQPLVYRAISSWFVKVTEFRDRMVELNQQITWQPAHIKDGSFGKWLENARDWSISRNRFWGSPIPVWQSDDPNHPRIDVYGSLAQLEADFGVTVTDLHRPYVDALTRPNPDDPTGRSTMRRVPEVLDCWFESGSMPFAQVHYPFENTEWFEHHYPGDFIVEYIAQTRGWFYTLHVLATALFDRPSFATCVSHGVVLGDDGQKMSKSLNNYPDPRAMFDSYGADAMRWHLLSSSILRGNDAMVTETGMRDTVRHVLLPLWNSWYFLALYANASDHRGTVRTDSTNSLDQYILSKTRDLIADVTDTMDAYDLFGACQHVRNYVDVLTNWYVRRSRSRFWQGDHEAIDTMHTVLDVVTRLMAPLLPLISEAIYRGMHESADSVHLTDWPTVDELPAFDELVDTMDLVRDVCSATLSVRKAHQRRVRLPLQSVTIAAPDAERLRDFLDVIADEVNVRGVELTTDLAAVADERLQLVPAKLGPRLGKDVQTVIKAHKAGDWTNVDGVRHGRRPGARRRRVSTRTGGRRRPSQCRARQPARRDRPRHRGHRRTRAGGHRPRPDPTRPAGPSGCRSGGVRSRRLVDYRRPTVDRRGDRPPDDGDGRDTRARTRPRGVVDGRRRARDRRPPGGLTRRFRRRDHARRVSAIAVAGRAYGPVESAAQHAGKEARMAASKKPNPAPSKKSAPAGRAAPKKAPAKKAPAAKRTAAPASAPTRKSSTSRQPAATKARATKATTTTMNKSAATTPAPRKSTATPSTGTKATAKKAPAKNSGGERAGDADGGHEGGRHVDDAGGEGGTTTDAQAPVTRHSVDPVELSPRPPRDPCRARHVEGRHHLHEGLRREVPQIAA